jgi:plastocyanin
MTDGILKLLCSVLATTILPQILILIALAPNFVDQSSFGISGAREDKAIKEIIIPFGASYHQLQEDNYLPSPAVIQNGSIVTWINQDILDHTVTADDGSFDIRIIPPNSSGASIINAVGNITYHCKIHPWMKAILQSEATN